MWPYAQPYCRVLRGGAPVELTEHLARDGRLDRETFNWLDRETFNCTYMAAMYEPPSKVSLSQLKVSKGLSLSRERERSLIGDQRSLSLERPNKGLSRERDL